MLAFLLDENTGGDLVKAFHRRARLGELPAVDVVRVGEVDAPPTGTLDPELLLWCEANQRILVSNDRRTMPGHFATHLVSGRHSPGVVLIRRGTGIGQVVAELLMLTEAGHPDDFRNQIVYIPL